ncbi:hypothetical protein Dsin_027137 [Dipteronia sinensis]|uniref:RING-type E3 ubiquitin transferase n=1 Tax=Dipteronia sinensis TaxID=43782 RepID=A0AAE0DYJ2_9ROSI|nr:hypothetical protein Dsin_027137 [Dipteronia sinensis]
MEVSTSLLGEEEEEECACSGSIKFVHLHCLAHWLNHRKTRQCEVCKHAFSFYPVYAENAPARLPFQEFIVGMAMKACHVLQFFLQLSFVLSWWLDACTIRMFGKSISQRVQFFTVSPLASSLVHWIAGILCMLQIRFFFILLLEVLRSGVLNFLLDPVDPNYNPLRDLLKLARRVLLSVPMHGSLIVMLVFLPVKLSMRMAPSVFPLDISVSDPFTEIPADMLLFQICIPFAIELFKLRTLIKSLLRYWFTAVGWALGLTDFLLPRPDENGGQENGNGDAGRQDRLYVLQFGVLDGSVVAVLEADLNRVLASENSNVSEDYDCDEQSGSDLRVRLCSSHCSFAGD